MTPPTSQLVGTCSVCKGPVLVRTDIVLAIPACRRCGATPVNPYGPVVPMVQQRPMPEIGPEGD